MTKAYEWTKTADRILTAMWKDNASDLEIAEAVGTTPAIVSKRVTHHRKKGDLVGRRSAKAPTIKPRVDAVEFFLANPFGGSAYVAGDPETTIPAVNAMLAEGYTMLEGRA